MKHIKRSSIKYLVVFILLLSCLPVFAGGPVQGDESAEGVAFTEIWGYLMAGEERFWDASYPITDIGYFGAGLNAYGKLVGVPDAKKFENYPSRVHLVVAEVSNQALTHFSLNPAYPVRAELIASITEASAAFDGVQIDFEMVTKDDREHFISFLQELKARIGNKTLSVAVPARTKKIDDPYDYERISKIADRIIVMAYDEHWSGGVPGPIASIEWCRKVATYAVSVIGSEKLVMGLPFYGRAWADTNPAKAYKYSSLSTLMSDKQIGEIERTGEIPTFEYSETVKVRVYYDDVRSILSRSRMYREQKVRGISFWRLGQEDTGIWKELKIE